MSLIAFIALWVVLGLTILFVAFRGGPRKARQSLYGQGRGANRVAAISIAVIYVVFGALIPAVVLADNDRSDKLPNVSLKLTADEEEGRALFGTTCNQCHTLAAADTVGRVGPNLNELRPSYEIVANAIVHGQKRGTGTMPAGLVTGEQVNQVACFVVVSTSPEKPPPPECGGAKRSARTPTG